MDGKGKPHTIAEVTLDEANLIYPRPEVEHERAVAIYDLIEDNTFRPLEWDDPGPYALHLSVADNRLVLDLRHQGDCKGEPWRIVMPLRPLRSLIRDYFVVCESYFDAIKTASPSRIEAIDMGRRGLHNEGSELLRDRLADKADIDMQTARRLFTLLCVLHVRK